MLYFTFLTPKNSGFNSLSGSIPTEIGSLTSLTRLDFCKFCAKFLLFRWIVMIANLHLSPILHCLPPLSYFQHHKINRDGNYLFGSIPSEIGSLTSLTDLHFSEFPANTCTQSCSLKIDCDDCQLSSLTNTRLITSYRISNNTKFRLQLSFWVDSNGDRISYKLD
jgi:hypothetical protein